MDASVQKNDKIRREIYAYLLVVAGSLLFAVGDVMFVNPYHMAPGGTYGLANVFNTLWPWRISFYAICMDIPLLLIGTWILGPRFGVKTVVSTILIFLFTYILEKVWGYAPVLHDGIAASQLSDQYISFEKNGETIWFLPDYFINTVVAGLIYGFAIGLIFKSGATSGGSDIISMICNKYTKLPLGTLTLIVDGCITLTTLFAFPDYRLPIYSIILIYIESKVIDLVIDGTRKYKTVFIVTDHIDEVKSFILNDLERGGTCFAGYGLYKGTERKMIYVTLGRTDLVKLKTQMRYMDPQAFVNVIESSEVMGYGFKALPSTEN